MFAKLKKKIKDEGGTVVDGEKALSPHPIPGRANLIQRSSSDAELAQVVTKDPFMSGDSGAASPTSQSSEDSSMKGDSSREEVVSMLLKRTEQCKKMESKISEYASLIKERNKTIEKLEFQLLKQEEETVDKLEKQKEETLAKLSEYEENHKQELAKQNEEMHEKLSALEKKNLDLSESLKKEEDFKQKLFQREEEQDEVQGFTTQELAKVKHLLLLIQEELTQCKADLAVKSEACHELEKALKDVTNKKKVLDSKLAELEKENARLEEVNKQHVSVVTLMTNEKAVFEKRLDEVNAELTQKLSQLSKLTASYADLENEHKTLQRGSEIHKNKMNNLLSEKDDHIEQLQDRVKQLEQRSQDQSLSGDERFKALEAERDSVEHKLSETRQQLTEIKTSWSDKISHLEEQISHLNAKIVEDNEEMAALQQASENMRENFHKQLEDLRRKLEDAEKRALESWELASQKDRQYEKQKHDLERELQKSRMSAVDGETQLRSKIVSLEGQLLELEAARDHMKNEAEQRIAHLEAREQHFIEQQIKFEKEIKALEADHGRLQTEYTSKCDEYTKNEKLLEEKSNSEKVLQEKISKMEEEVQSLGDTLESLKKNIKSGHTDLRKSEKENDELLVRNAELSQQLTTLRQQASEREHTLVAEVHDKGETITELQSSVSQLEERLQNSDKKIEDYEAKQSEDQVTNATVDQMRGEITGLQDQLLEKNRTLKKQEQTLKDLRITLQRELKVQSLPNDDSSELTDSHSPVPNRKFESNRRTAFESSSHTSGSRGNQSHVQMATAGLMMHDDAKLRSGTLGIRQELDKDVNFQYLKHVILKFLLSRESEAMKLVKAIGMLLHFNREEQELIKQTLEYKMSWFGSKPALGKGQTSKIIPPSY